MWLLDSRSWLQLFHMVDPGRVHYYMEQQKSSRQDQVWGHITWVNTSHQQQFISHLHFHFECDICAVALVLEMIISSDHHHEKLLVRVTFVRTISAIVFSSICDINSHFNHYFCLYKDDSDECIVLYWERLKEPFKKTGLFVYWRLRKSMLSET